MAFLEVKNLHVKIEGKEILKGITLSVDKNQVVAIMGPNGSGKSTLAYALMGHPRYEITEGNIILNGEDITKLEANERAKKGLFLSFQYPQEISGVTVSNFLRTALNAKSKNKISVLDFHKILQERMKLLNFDKSFALRYLNEGFSGGEKKKAEILQMQMLQPNFSIIDEVDSGLDIDSLKVIASNIENMRQNKMSGLIVTHYQRILNYVKPDFIHIMMEGKIVKTGKEEIVKQIEEKGYQSFKKD